MPKSLEKLAARPPQRSDADLSDAGSDQLLTSDKLRLLTAVSVQIFTRRMTFRRRQTLTGFGGRPVPPQLGQGW
jgi:hypothetical protein